VLIKLGLSNAPILMLPITLLEEVPMLVSLYQDTTADNQKLNKISETMLRTQSKVSRVDMVQLSIHKNQATQNACKEVTSLLTSAMSKVLTLT